AMPKFARNARRTTAVEPSASASADIHSKLANGNAIVNAAAGGGEDCPPEVGEALAGFGRDEEGLAREPQALPRRRRGRGGLVLRQLVALGEDGGAGPARLGEPAEELDLLVLDAAARVDEHHHRGEDAPVFDVPLDERAEARSHRLRHLGVPVAGEIHEGEPGPALRNDVEPVEQPGATR